MTSLFCLFVSLKTFHFYCDSNSNITFIVVILPIIIEITIEYDPVTG